MTTLTPEKEAEDRLKLLLTALDQSPFWADARELGIHTDLRSLLATLSTERQAREALEAESVRLASLCGSHANAREAAEKEVERLNKVASNGMTTLALLCGWDSANKRTRAAEAKLAALEEVRRAAANYVRCSTHPGLTPYIKENGRYGTKSPWTELREALSALRASPISHETKALVLAAADNNREGEAQALRAIIGAFLNAEAYRTTMPDDADDAHDLARQTHAQMTLAHKWLSDDEYWACGEAFKARALDEEPETRAAIDDLTARLAAAQPPQQAAAAAATNKEASRP